MSTQTYQNKQIQVPTDFPPQKQDQQPGSQQEMTPKPLTVNPNYRGSGKLRDRVAIITGGDSGIGQAIAVVFAKEGADVAIAYYSECEDASETIKLVEAEHRSCIPVKCDLKQEQSAMQVVDAAIKEFGHIDILINNIAVQYPQNSILDITAEQLRNTFETNIFSYFYMTKAVLPHLKAGSCIINTTSVTAYKGNETLIDYSASKGAIVSFTRSLEQSLAKNGIRVNAIAPGPVWTPLITSSFESQDVDKFGQNNPLGRAAQPFELAPAYVYLASDDSAFVNGQVLHVNGGAYMSS
jgi:NAD(P)-dependent dehydrogenase (short-subunit alcohol dehydrogenase family)